MNITNDFREEPWLQPEPKKITCPECLTIMEQVDTDEYVCPECGFELIDYSDGGFDPDQKHDEA